MAVRGLEVWCFRCYERSLWEFSQEGVRLIGPNGAGKTTLLEAIAKVAILRGFGSDAEMTRWGAPGYRLRARLELTPGESGIVEVRYEQKQGVQLSWEGAPVVPLRAWVGRLPVVIFRPGDIEWIEGGGAVRRRWADRLLSQLYPTYLEALVQYEKALAQRNALLKADPPPTVDVLIPWEHLLMQAGLELQRQRLWLAQALQPLLEDTHAFATDAGSIRLSYKLSTESPSPQAWQTKWPTLRREELRRGHTLMGPHLEDFTLEFKAHPAKGYASEGQKKWLLIALRWAEMRLFKRLHGQQPLLLLDDVGEKLDQAHLAALARLGREAKQVFLTDVEVARTQSLFPNLDLLFIQAAS